MIYFCKYLSTFSKKVRKHTRNNLKQSRRITRLYKVWFPSHGISCLFKYVHFFSLHFSKEDVCVDVLKAYISLLIRDQQTELVASYVGQLPAELATAQYAAFLETVSQVELRPRCLELATDAGKTQTHPSQ